jgi:AcrR family transcriptional regulator
MDAIARKPMQQRSRATLERLLAAGVALLRERGYEGLSIAEVSARSGVSVGSIYQRFDGKEALFAALQERILEAIDAEQRDLFSGIDRALPDTRLVREAIGRLAALFRRHEPLLRVMILRGAVDEATRQRGSRSSVVLAQAFEGFLLSSVRTFGHERPEIAADVSFRIVYATLTRRIMSGPNFESGAEISWDELAAEVARACAAYLLSATPA